MPRRKRTSGESGRKAKVCRVEELSEDETLIISDSENEEEEDCSVNRSSRTARFKRRENQTKLQDMTEDEMLDLAMKLSAQEANQRRQLEDNDIQKAIAESLNVADRDGDVETSSSAAQPQQSISGVSRLRRKLMYPSQNQTRGGSDVTERESTSPLPEMPNLSETTASLSSNSSAQVFELPKSSQHDQESSQDKMSQPIISDSEADKLSQSDSQPQRSPAIPIHSSFIRQPLVCVEKLSQDLINASTGLRDHLHTQDSTVGPSVFPSQDNSSHIFTPNDFDERTDPLEDKHDPCTSPSNESNTQISDLSAYPEHKGLSPKNNDSDEFPTPSRRIQPLRPKCEPEDANADVSAGSKAPDAKQVKDQISQVGNVAAHSESCSNTRSLNEFTSHMVLHLQDDDDDDDGSDEVLSPSPILPDKTAGKRLSSIQPCISSAASDLDSSTQNTQKSLQEDSKGLKSKSLHSKTLHTGVENGECTVSYYWGVPFCPVGQNPDEYTRVIMCQLEVYEKSLKEAQRELLRKVEWGQPVVPDSPKRPFSLRRLKRHRAPQLSEDEEQNEDDEQKENKRKEVEEEKGEDREESVVGSEDGAGGQSETTYVVLSSPETKDEDVPKKPFRRQETTAAHTPIRNDARDASDNTQIEHADDEEEVQNPKLFEDEDIICPETQMSENNSPELMMTSPASPIKPESRADSEVMDVDVEEGAPGPEEVVMELENVPTDIGLTHNQKMACPMCSKLFPLSKIEMHAAFCDGEEDNNHQGEQSQAIRGRRAKRDPPEETPENGSADSPGGSEERSATTSSNACIPLSDCHTDLQQQDFSKNSQRLSRKRKFKR
ncbi:uncharacterized protein uimc1 [Misgurnus anguillicaudatus]|uniref:uncharacterized protein uimc1 n=1 Tax=Misgurnus anguillicaudatus TaxID=75329 RepID=UPI003CCF31FF